MHPRDLADSAEMDSSI